MSSSTAKFVPTLGGRVWRLQRQGGQITSAVMESAGKSSSSTRSSLSSFSQRGSASFSTGCSSIGQGQGQPKPNNSWAHRC